MNPSSTSPGSVDLGPMSALSLFKGTKTNGKAQIVDCNRIITVIFLFYSQPTPAYSKQWRIHWNRLVETLPLPTQARYTYNFLRVILISSWGFLIIILSATIPLNCCQSLHRTLRAPLLVCSVKVMLWLVEIQCYWRVAAVASFFGDKDDGITSYNILPLKNMGFITEKNVHRFFCQILVS